MDVSCQDNEWDRSRLFADGAVMPRTSEPSPKLLDQVRDKLRVLHYASRTEQAYLMWVERFLRYRGFCGITVIGMTGSGDTHARWERQTLRSF